MLLIASDIFGLSQETQSQANQIGARLNIEVKIITPYYSHERFPNDKLAYQAFVKAGGLPAYIDKIKQFNNPEKVQFLLGFSAGAAAFWCANELFTKVKYQILLYPGQIRDYLDLTPCIPTQVLLARHEPTSCVQSIAQALNQKQHVDALITPYDHGFINPQSIGYDEQASEQYRAAVCAHIHNMLND